MGLDRQLIDELLKGCWDGGRERHSGRYAPLGNAGILRCAQNDDVKLTTARTKATAKARAGAPAKTKYRDLSTAAAKCAAFGRDDVCYGGVKKNSQPQRTRTTARTRAGWET